MKQVWQHWQKGWHGDNHEDKKPIGISINSATFLKQLASPAITRRVATLQYKVVDTCTYLHACHIHQSCAIQIQDEITKKETAMFSKVLIRTFSSRYSNSGVWISDLENADLCYGPDKAYELHTVYAVVMHPKLPMERYLYRQMISVDLRLVESRSWDHVKCRIAIELLRLVFYSLTNFIKSFPRFTWWVFSVGHMLVPTTAKTPFTIISSSLEYRLVNHLKGETVLLWAGGSRTSPSRENNPRAGPLSQFQNLILALN